jgi:peptidoglycan/xylan/chitin deacetylase (PgdA/CDA1 family)
MIWLLAIGCVAQATQAPAGWQVAVTLDDVPWNGPRPEGGVHDGTARILATLAAHDAPAVAFVNCEGATPQVLDQWRAAGVELGNHHATHADLDKTDPELWLADAHRCTAALPGVRWFRYPYLRRGKTPQVRDHVRAELEASGLQIAPVSIDNHEWALASAYAKGNPAAADLYVPHLLAASAHFRSLAVEQHGREVPQILLLHVNQLAADHLDDLLTALEAQGATFVTLETAMADPVYAMPDLYAGPGGISWLYRVSDAPVTLEWDSAEWERLQGALNP